MQKQLPIVQRICNIWGHLVMVQGYDTFLVSLLLNYQVWHQFMHAISRCDIVSSLYGIGKKTAWAVWRSLPNLHEIFARLSNAPNMVSSDNMKQ